MPLPDSETNGISLCDGRLTGLTNLTRWGDAAIDERYKKNPFLQFMDKNILFSVRPPNGCGYYDKGKFCRQFRLLTCP